MSASAEKQS